MREVELTSRTTTTRIYSKGTQWASVTEYGKENYSVSIGHPPTTHNLEDIEDLRDVLTMIIKDLS